MTSSFRRPTTSERAPYGLRTLRALAWAALSVAVLAATGAVAAEKSVDQVLAAVQKRYQSIRDIRADFEQEARVASIDRTERSKGAVSIARPGRMRWEYTAPEARVVALDGTAIRMYLPEDSQLQIAPIGAGSLPPTALDFLLGDGDLGRSFQAELLPQQGRPEVGLRLRPRSDASFEYLELWVDAKTYQLRESVVLDLFGNRTSVRFSAIRENGGIDAATFQVKVPEGTEIIDLRSEP